MSYAPTTDFLALLRLTAAGVRTERMPGLDYIVAAMARAGMFTVSVSDTAPTSNQSTTAWFKTATPAWSGEGVLYLWDADTLQYEIATTMLWAELFATTGRATNTQNVTTPGPVNIGATVGIVLVNQSVGAPITLLLPPSATKIGEVIVSDWKGDAGTNNITITATGGDVLPGGQTSWKIADDTGSITFRPVAGLGYVI